MNTYSWLVTDMPRFLAFLRSTYGLSEDGLAAVPWAGRQGSAKGKARGKPQGKGVLPQDNPYKRSGIGELEDAEVAVLRTTNTITLIPIASTVQL